MSKLLLGLLATVINGFHIPGLVPKNYEEGEKLIIMAGSLHSSKMVFPFHYFMMPWC